MLQTLEHNLEMIRPWQNDFGSPQLFGKPAFGRLSPPVYFHRRLRQPSSTRPIHDYWQSKETPKERENGLPLQVIPSAKPEN